MIDESRRRFLDAAEEVFAEKGFAKASFADIAERAGISRGSISAHFGNKEGLLMAVLERATDILHERAPTAAPSIDEAVAAGGAALREPQMAFLMTVLADASQPDSPAHDRYVEFHRKNRQDIEGWLDTTVGLHLEGVEDDALAAVIYAMFVGLHVQWRVAPELVDLQAGLNAMAALLKAGLK